MKTITLTPDASGMVDWPTLSNDKKSVVTIGSFDGMHQGHQAVIRRVAELAEQEQSFSVVVLFDPRPALVHAYAAKHDGQEPPAGTPDTQALTSVDERLRAIDAIGVDYTLIVRYTMAFSAKSYRFFLGQMVGKLGMRTLVLGSEQMDVTMVSGDAVTVTRAINGTTAASHTTADTLYVRRFPRPVEGAVRRRVAMNRWDQNLGYGAGSPAMEEMAQTSAIRKATARWFSTIETYKRKDRVS